MDKKISALVSFLLSLLLILILAAYRKIVTFNQLCDAPGGLETGLNLCLSFAAIFTVTLMSPIGLTVVIIGAPIIYMVLRKLN